MNSLQPNSMFVRLVLVVVLLTVAGPLVGNAAEVAFQDRYHTDHRTTPKLVFFPEVEARGSGDAESVGRAYLETYGELYQLPSAPADIRLWRVRESLLGTHLRFQQDLHGFPVEGAEIIVSVGHDLRVSKVYNNTYPVIERPVMPEQIISGDIAVDIAWHHLKVHGEILDMTPTAELVWVPEGLGFRLIHLTQVNVTEPFGRWQHSIDAVTGEILSVRRTEISKVPQEMPDFAGYDGPVHDRGQAVARFEDLEQERLSAKAGKRATVDGSGLVFDPDPRTTLADDSLMDNSPAGNFDAAYLQRTLSDITENAGTYSLVGPWVTIVNFESPNTQPSTTNDGIWTAVRGDNAFNDAVTYFHIDQNQRYMQSLGFIGATGIQQGSISVDTDALNGADNSYYSPSLNRLAFGHGCVDDNEDADVILHEYMHAITHDINPSWNGGHTGAIGEGLGDYWGGSYSYSTPNGPTYHPAWAFTWDGQLACWPGRDMDDHTQMYNPACTYSAHSSCGGRNADQLWSTCMFSSLVDLVGQGRTRE
ncbi:MAG: hypothetical protein ABFS37_16675, partial [Acidobacteriota bacterium]